MHTLFAWRYFKAKKSTNAINVIARVSIAAIIVGTTALILVLSVFNGFEDLVKSLYSSFYTDLKIMPDSGKTIRVSDAQFVSLRKIPGVKNLTAVVEDKVFVQNGDNQALVQLKGVDEQYRYVTGVEQYLVKGDFELGTIESPRLILGVGLEGALGIQAERNLFELKMYLARRGISEQFDQLNDISFATINSSAAFMIQQEFDNTYGITNIGFIKQALKYAPDEYSGVEISITDPDEAEAVQKRVQSLMGAKYAVKTRYQQNQSLYSIMNMERWIIYGVLCLILVVAAFNMIGSLMMLVLEKQKDISVIHALGGSRSFIQRIFLTEGLLLAMIGTVTGMVIAAIIAVLQMQFHLIPLTGGSFLIDYFPVKLRWTDFLLVTVTVFVIALIASWLPARKAARQNFSLRSE